MMKLSKSLTVTLFFFAFSGLAQAESVDQVIAKARKELGGSDKLNAIKTLQYEGIVTDKEGTESKLTLVFKKPYLQYLKVEKADGTTDTTAINGYEGWREVTSITDRKQNRTMVLPTNQVQYLISNATENLFFFEGPSRVSGAKAELLGKEKMNGKECWKVKFSYPSGLQYTRYFDMSAGNLVATTAQGGEMKMVEEDTIVVDGIKFPKKVDSFNDNELIRSVTFNSIKVNEPVDDTLFDFPTLPRAPSDSFAK